MPREPTKAQLIDLHAKEIEGYQSQIMALHLQVDELQTQLAQVRQALREAEDRQLGPHAWEEEPSPPRPGLWQRLRCGLGWHEPNAAFLMLRNPPCLHCRRFQRGYR
jgi:hypothetical protein